MPSLIFAAVWVLIPFRACEDRYKKSGFRDEYNVLARTTSFLGSSQATPFLSDPRLARKDLYPGQF